MPMRRTLGPLLPAPLLTTVLATVLATGVLAGCGSDTSDRANDPSPTSASPISASSSPSDGSTGAPTVTIVSATGAGGRVDQHPTVLDGPSAVRAYASQFTNAELTRKVTSAAAAASSDLSAEQVLVAAVVSIGCDVPGDVAVDQAGGALTITAVKVANPQQECFAPVTSVALVTVDASAV